MVKQYQEFVDASLTQTALELSYQYAENVNTVKQRRLLGRGTGPTTWDPVRFTVKTICFTALSNN